MESGDITPGGEAQLSVSCMKKPTVALVTFGLSAGLSSTHLAFSASNLVALDDFPGLKSHQNYIRVHDRLGMLLFGPV